MGFFARLFRYNFKKRRGALLDKIESTEEVLRGAKIYELRAPLRELFDLIDDRSVTLKKDQVKLLEGSLAYIKSHAKAEYVEQLKNKCYKMINIVRGEESAVSSYSEEVSERNEDKLCEMEAELKSIQKEIEIVKGQMDDVLGVDKIKWNRLNSKRKQLTTKYDVKYQSYVTLTAQQENVSVSIALEEAKEEATYINEQREIVDVSNAQISADLSNEALNEARETNEKLNEIVGATVGSAVETDYEYMRALEAKLEKEKLTSGTGSEANGKEKEN